MPGFTDATHPDAKFRDGSFELAGDASVSTVALPGATAQEDPFVAPTWALALDFTERLESLRRHGSAGSVDRDLAARRLERWRGQAPFVDHPEIWKRRLESDGLTETELETLLGEAPEAIHARMGATPWLDELRAAYSAELAKPFAWPQSAAEGLSRNAFLELAEPLVDRASQRLLAVARAYEEDLDIEASELPFEAVKAVDALLGHLPDLLGLLLGRTLVVELHAAREEGYLEGETREARFSCFAQMLRRREVALDLLSAYPVLARRMVQCVTQWYEASRDFLAHLAADALEIRGCLVDKDLGHLAEVKGGVSDPHRGGRSVFLLRFDSGVRLVYKPRSLGVEKAFQDLLAWLNKRDSKLAFRTLRILDFGDHGWVEHVEPKACPDVPALRRFFRRQGAYAALFDLLDGNDLHHENLIAAGEQPILVDLETLFHPWIEGGGLSDIDELPGAALRHSVMRSGLLPQRVWGGEDTPGVDISGLGAQEDQLTPRAMLRPSARGTDAMRYERQKMKIPIGENRPRLADGADIDFLEHRDVLEEGFRRIFDLAQEHRAELMAPEGPLAAFSGHAVRVLFQPTATYGAMRLESFHPHVQSNALEWQFLLDRIWAATARRPFLAPLISAEQNDLRRDDIPWFIARAGEPHLWASSGERYGNLFADSGLDRVRARLAKLGPDLLERQVSTMRGSFEVVRMRKVQPRPSYRFQERSEPAARSELLAAASKIGERLVQTSFRSPSEALWLTVQHSEPEGWGLQIAGADLYLGLPGVALFLAHLGERTGEPSFSETARLALAAQNHLLAAKDSRFQPADIGLFNGWGGLIWTHTHLGVLWQDPGLLDQAEAWVGGLLPQVAEDSICDIVAGSAGLLVALLALAPHRPSELLWRTARACGDRLLAKAERQEAGGLGWRMPLAGDIPLAGLSHGVAGISLALLRLEAATGESRYRHAALEGLVYERSLYDRAEANWPDLRVDDTPTGDHQEDSAVASERFMCAWCHGATGIGLARLVGLPMLDGAKERQEIEIAISTTLEKGFGHNHCLCHGDLGSLDFLLEAALSLDNPDLFARVGRLAGGVLDGMAEHGRLYGLPGNLETVGLMVGLAGLGYGLLRVAEPEHIPSILALDPPGGGRAAGRYLSSPTRVTPEPGVGGSGVLYRPAQTKGEGK